MLFVTLCFVGTFLWMEWAAWALHKYVMHGFLWSLHEDHHVVQKKIFQKNDFFAGVFALPSFLLLLAGKLQANPYLSAAGWGMTCYGFVYFLVHESIIHQRVKLNVSENWYIKGLKKAHKAHHSICTKEGAFNFGMLWVPVQYFNRVVTKP